MSGHARRSVLPPRHVVDVLVKVEERLRWKNNRSLIRLSLSGQADVAVGVSASDTPTPVQIPQNPSVSPPPSSFQRNGGTCHNTEPDQTALAQPSTELPPRRALG